VGTVGLIESKPNSRNVVPGEVFFSIDLRHPDDAVLAEMDVSLRDAVAEIAEADGLGLVLEQTWLSPAVHFDAACRTRIAASSPVPDMTAPISPAWPPPR